MTVLARTRADLALARAALQGTVAFVPTMGALHEGHRSLLIRGRDLADNVVVSIFVNPLQFGPSEDLARYPRDLDADLAMCAAEGVSLVFAPSRDEMYPNEPIVRVSAGVLGDRYEGSSRPGHFDGVLTVVAKLFGLVAPDVAIFSRKDAQQLALVQRMVSDLELPVRIDAAPFIRDADGLALSSRNQYLSPTQRTSALALSAALMTAAGVAERGGSPAQIVAAARGVLDETPGVETDYVALVDEGFEAVPLDDPLAVQNGANLVLAVAARVGATRLIDNVSVTLDAQQLTGPAS